MRRRFFVSVAICLDATAERVEHSTRLQRWEFHYVRPAYRGKRRRPPDVRAVTGRDIASMSIQVEKTMARYPGTDMIVFFEAAMHGPLHACAAQDPLVDEAVFQALAAKNRIWIIHGTCFVQCDGKTYNHAARKAELAIVRATAAMLSCYVVDRNGRNADGASAAR